MKFSIYTLSITILIGLLLTACENNPAGSGINPALPDVDFTYTKTPLAGQKVTFVGKQNQISSKITSWKWNFGDADSSTATEKTVTFTYQKAGSYQVVLTATDVNGKTAKATHTVNVQKKAFQASIAWSYTTGNTVQNPNDEAKPAIGDNGTIYYLEGWAGGGNSQVIAVTDNGSSATLEWTAKPGHRMRQALAIAPDGNIVVGDWSLDAMHKISSKDGSILWNFKTNRGVSNCTSAIDAAGNIYFGTKGSSKSGIVSVDPSGKLRWRDKDIGSVYTSPAISNDGKTVYFYTQGSGILHAINTADGKFNWGLKVSSDGAYGTSLSIGSDGTIYLTTGSDVVAVTDKGSSGSVKWKAKVTSPAKSGVAISPNGNLYTGSQGGLVSINPDDGSINWVNDNLVIGQSVPAVDSNGNIYVGSINGKFAIISPAGKLLKELTLGSGMVYSPVISDDGTVYVSVFDGGKIKLYKITVPNSNGPANSNWPMKGQNRYTNSHS